MGDFSIWTVAGQLARALGQLAAPNGKETPPGEPSGQGLSFGEMLLQRQQTLGAGPARPALAAFETPPLLAPPAAGGALSSPELRAEDGRETPGAPLQDWDREQVLAEARRQEELAAARPRITQVVGPDGKTGNAFGHWELKPAQQPYFGIPEAYLDADMKQAIEDWKQHPYNLVWVYDVEPGPDNNWAGWGPPPPGWTTRSEIPRANGAFLGKALPWPPPGDPQPAWTNRS